MKSIACGRQALNDGGRSQAIETANAESRFLEEKPEDAGKYVDAVANGIFAAGLTALKAKLA